MAAEPGSEGEEIKNDPVSSLESRYVATNCPRKIENWQESCSIDYSTESNTGKSEGFYGCFIQHFL